jgi:aconitate hydratase
MCLSDKRLQVRQKNGLTGISKLPYSLKVLLENLLRHEDGRTVTKDDIQAMAWVKSKGKSTREIAYRPARVLMQDFTGVPAVVDLAAMRDAMVSLGGDPKKINPLAGRPGHRPLGDGGRIRHRGRVQEERDMEYERNGERYKFLKWGQDAFDNFRVVPPGTGICHQVNLEYLARPSGPRKVNGAATVAYPDTLVGTDSHTTMVNGLAVLGWGVGGIEAEAAMLGQPISMLIPKWSASG